ncbi:MAG: hypothetical protein R3C53_08825 [Pirellulaceae bacterium]
MSATCRHATAARPGISLIEVIVSTLLVGLLLAAALVSVGSAARSTTVAAVNNDAIFLALNLIEEITVLPYEDPDQPPLFGQEPGENQGKKARNQADDVDDLANWTELYAEDRDGNILTGYENWSRSVSVVQSGDSTKTIEVTVTSPSGDLTTLTAVRAKEGGCLQLQGVEQTLVTWVGVELQTGMGDQVLSGVSLTNHAADQ